MKLFYIFLLSFFVTSCLLQEGKLELRPDHVDARIAIFKDIKGSETGPFVRYTVDFEFTTDGLSQEQIDGVQNFTVFKNGEERGVIDKNATSFNGGQSVIGDRVCYRLGMVLLIDGQEIKTLPGTAEICN